MDRTIDSGRVTVLCWRPDRRQEAELIIATIRLHQCFDQLLKTRRRRRKINTIKDMATDPKTEPRDTYATLLIGCEYFMKSKKSSALM